MQYAYKKKNKNEKESNKQIMDLSRKIILKEYFKYRKTMSKLQKKQFNY